MTRLLPFVLLVLTSCQSLNQAAQLLAQAQRLPGAGAAVGVSLTPPSITFDSATLVESPARATWAAHFCPQVTGVPLACQLAFGAPPSPAQMRVSFDLRFRVRNPNHAPIPVAELLAAVTVFPQQGNQKLGSTCVSFCGANQPGCTGQPGPGACQSRSNDLHTMQDLGHSAANFLLSAGATLLAGGTPSFVMPQVVQDSEVVVTARFSFGPDQLLPVLRQLAEQSVTQLRVGQQPTWTIPWRLQGAVWFDLGSLGRVEVGYGPAQGTWTLPQQALHL